MPYERAIGYPTKPCIALGMISYIVLLQTSTKRWKLMVRDVPSIQRERLQGTFESDLDAMGALCQNV